MSAPPASPILYDRIGQQYSATRQADPRIAAAISAALAGAESIVNVGAGAGAYEPDGRHVVAVEPSWKMIQQRPPRAAPVIQSPAEALPFRTGAFAAALAVLTVHHWGDWRRGLAEMKRVAQRLVILTIDPGEVGRFWLTATYFPEIAAVDRGRCPPVAELVAYLGNCRVDPVLIPHDCIDGFLAAFWRRPEAYLDPAIRAGMSGFALLAPDVIDRGLAQLKSDLASGEWERRCGHLRSLEALDASYRLLVVN